MAALDALARDMGKPHTLVTGRATTALYLLLEARGVRDREVVLPVNLCYSIVHAVTLSGNRPVFVDVDPRDGNTRIEHVRSAVSDLTAAVLLPHQYGNPCPDTAAIAGLCARHGTLLVEDCAAGFEGQVDGRPLGSFGSHVILSFGAGKTVDATLGGALLSAEPLAELEPLERRLPEHSARIAELTALYSGIYRLVYHSGYFDELSGAFASLDRVFAEIYRFRLRQDEVARVHDALRRHPEKRARRRAIAEAYDEGLPFGPGLERYPFAAGALPWRYNVRVTALGLRARIVETLLEAGVRVSVWYPPVHRQFGDDGDYPNAARFCAEILNLDLEVSPERAAEICARIRRAVEAPGARP